MSTLRRMAAALRALCESLRELIPASKRDDLRLRIAKRLLDTVDAARRVK